MWYIWTFKKHRVPHQRLLLKIESMGIKGKLLTWLSAWLSNRQQRVVLNGGMSDWVNVRSGVPQGSVLGPLLFVIFINNIDVDIISKIFKFADDCKVINKATSVVDTSAIQDDLKKLFEWSLDWQLLFNLDKCKVMHIGSSNSKVDYYLGDHKLSVVHEEKDLGIIVQDDLKVSRQCAKVVQTANRILGMIYRTFTCRSREIILKLYKSLVRHMWTIASKHGVCI